MGLSNVYGVPGRSARPPARVIDGRAIAAEERAAIAVEIGARVDRGVDRPTLATVLVGDDPASAAYVGSKIKACAEVGLGSAHHHLPADATRERVLGLIDELNRDPAIAGILCQLPVPAHLDAAELTQAIDPAKDVDGLTVANAGRLALGLPGLRPCTPLGVTTILERSGIELAGRRAVVLGRSNLFGKPMAQMLTAADATVTLCHSCTPDLAATAREADVLIAAVGRPRIVRHNWIKPGATVLDVGISRLEDGLVGDVDFEEALAVAGAVTPVPGGVGPMTIASLMRNTLAAAEATEAKTVDGV